MHAARLVLLLLEDACRPQRAGCVCRAVGHDDVGLRHEVGLHATEHRRDEAELVRRGVVDHAADRKPVGRLVQAVSDAHPREEREEALGLDAATVHAVRGLGVGQVWGHLGELGGGVDARAEPLQGLGGTEPEAR